MRVAELNRSPAETIAKMGIPDVSSAYFTRLGSGLFTLSAEAPDLEGALDCVSAALNDATHNSNWVLGDLDGRHVTRLLGAHTVDLDIASMPETLVNIYTRYPDMVLDALSQYAWTHSPSSQSERALDLAEDLRALLAQEVTQAEETI